MSVTVDSNLSGLSGGGSASPLATYEMTIDAVTTAPTKHSDPAIDVASFTVINGLMFLRYDYESGGSAGATGDGGYLFPLPAGYEADPDFISPSNDDVNPVVGNWAGFQNEVGAFGGSAVLYDATHVWLYDIPNVSTVGSSFLPLDQTVKFSFTAVIPVVVAV